MRNTNPEEGLKTQAYQVWYNNGRLVYVPNSSMTKIPNKKWPLVTEQSMSYLPGSWPLGLIYALYLYKDVDTY